MVKHPKGFTSLAAISLIHNILFSGVLAYSSIEGSQQNVLFRKRNAPNDWPTFNFSISLRDLKVVHEIGQLGKRGGLRLTKTAIVLLLRIFSSFFA